jgi:hypothetical protein
MMRTAIMLSVLVALFCGSASAGQNSAGFSPYVDAKGNISFPTDFRSTWVHLGTWVATSKPQAGMGAEQAAPVPGFHDVYTQTSSLRIYKKSGTWPDGSVIVMEVRALAWDDLATGHVMMEGDPLQWFMMVKDNKGRFPGNPIWGNGWGWAMFKPAAAAPNTVKDFKQDCFGCHEPASNDFIYRQGYPVLN